MLALEASGRTANTDDPIIGRWFWKGDLIVVFEKNGTCTISNGFKGVWQFLNNAEVERKYSLNWDHGHFLDRMTIARTGRSAVIEDQIKGDRFDIRKSTE
jgi:hypothetical protein